MYFWALLHSTQGCLCVEYFMYHLFSTRDVVFAFALEFFCFILYFLRCASPHQSFCTRSWVHQPPQHNLHLLSYFAKFILLFLCASVVNTKAYNCFNCSAHASCHDVDLVSSLFAWSFFCTIVCFASLVLIQQSRTIDDWDLVSSFLSWFNHGSLLLKRWLG